MREVPFVDAHVHYWDLGHIEYPWLSPPFGDDGPNGSVEAIAGTYLPTDHLAEATGWNVVGTVHVEAGAAPREGLAETRWLDGLADAGNLPSAMIAHADLTLGNLDEVLAAHAAHHRVKGIRQILNWHEHASRSYTPRDLTLDTNWLAGFGRLGAHGLSFDLQCYPSQMERFAAAAAAHPEVAVMVNHLGMPILDDEDGLGAWRRGMAALAQLPQISVKLSGFGFASRVWTDGLVRRLVRETIELFGPARVMAASDFPTDRLFGTFDRTLGALAAAIDDLPGPQREAIWGANACRLYRLDTSILGARP